MPKEVIGFYISKSHVFCSQTSLNKDLRIGKEMLHWLASFGKSLNIFWDIDYNASCLISKLSLTVEQLQDLLSNTKIQIGDCLLTYIPNKFLSVKAGTTWESPYAMYANASQYFVSHLQEGNADYAFKCALEAQNIGTQVRDTLDTLRISPDNLISPINAFCKAYMGTGKKWQFPTVSDTDEIDAEIGEYAFSALDAGFFECFQKGHWDKVFDFDLNCYSDDTEVLTADGEWKLIKQLQLGEHILTFNKNIERCEFEPILQLHASPYIGNMVHIKAQRTDLLITPNHNILLKHHLRNKLTKHYKLNGTLGYLGKWENVQAQDIPNGNFRIPCSFPLIDRSDYPIPDGIIKLMGWIITEGYWRRDKENKTYGWEKGKTRGKGLSLSQSITVNASKCLEIENILSSLNLQYRKEYHTDKRTNKSMIAFIIRFKDSNHYLNNLFENDIHIIPTWMIKGLSLRQLELLYNSMIDGDGTTKSDTQACFFTKSEVSANRFMAMCQLLGYRSFVYSRIGYKNRVRYHVNISKSIHTSDINYSKKLIDKNHYYSGFVYCPTVNNGYIIIRRNGKTCICGNSAYSAAMSVLPDIRKGSWELVHEFQEVPIAFYKADVTINSNFSPIGFRTKNFNFTPTGTWERILTQQQCEFIRKWNIGDFVIKDGYTWKPFEWDNIYLPLQKRLYELRQQNTGIAKDVIKRIQTGLWGKQLEQRGEKFGEFYNPVIGCLVEINTRLKVAGACMHHGILPISLALDGLVTDKPLDKLNMGTDLGQWKLSHQGKCINCNTDLCLIEGKDSKQVFTATYEWLKNEIEQNPDASRYTMTRNSCVTVGKVIQNPRLLGSLGEIVPTDRSIDLNVEFKRVYPEHPQTGRELLSGKIYSSLAPDISMLQIANLPESDDNLLTGIDD